MEALKIKSQIRNLFYVAIVGLMFSSCGESKKQATDGNVAGTTQLEKPEASVKPAGQKENKGIGPVIELHLEAINNEMVKEGKSLFESNCSACHKVDQRYVGPPLQGITSRRSPEWIMNMILNPGQMIKEDPIAKGLLAEFMAPMPDQNLSEEQARKILEYFRTLK